MKQTIGIRILTATALAATLGACATSKSVDQKIAEAQAQTSKKVESVEGQVEDLQNKQKATDTHMYVRLAFAVAAHLEPDVLIVDEVLAVGDIAFQRKCLGKM